MSIGAHVSAAGGLFNGPKNAGEIGCETFQFFSRPPQGGKIKDITNDDAKLFQQTMKQFNIKSAYIHAPYIINLASTETRIRFGSHSILREELERGSKLGVKGMMFHPGSAKDVSQKEAEKMVIEGLNRILDGYTGSCQLLIENSAGAGMVMGDSFEELAEFIHGAERGKEIGICYDTQHGFASGYDIRTAQKLDELIAVIKKTVGIKKIVASHVNDSKIELNGHKDRHEQIGDGLIGKKGIQLFTQHPELQHVDLLLETPDDDIRAKEVKLLQKWRSV